MAGTPSLRIKKYFGSATIQEMIFTMDDAKGFLAYFFTKEGGSNIMIAVEGQQIYSYEDLVKIAGQDRYKSNAFVEVGLYLIAKY
jgi:hypothetical protein